MSYPRHPKAEQVEKMLMGFCRNKEILSELRVDWRVIQRQRTRLGLKKIWATEEERNAIADKRGVSRKLVA
jgi:hypothetical protein